MKQRRLKIVGVVGSGSRRYPELSNFVGKAVAKSGCHLLTGGGGGVMEEASKAFCEISPREGICIGILRGDTYPESGNIGTRLFHTPSYINDWVELPIHTHLPLSGRRGREQGSRNHINVLSPDVLVALPGGNGTYSEVTLRIDYGREVILFLGGGNINGYTEGYFRSLSYYDGQVHIAHSEGELEYILLKALGIEATPPENNSLLQTEKNLFLQTHSLDLEPPFAETNSSGKDMVDDPLDQPFVFPSMLDKRVLIVGVGGGSDIISAYALAEMLGSREPAKFIYANVKSRIRENLQHRSAHIYELPAERITLMPGMHTHGTTLIDQSMPRGTDSCPLILQLPGEGEVNECAQLVQEIQEMSFDMIISVDTGGDSIVREAISGPKGRDQRMIEILALVSKPWLHVVIAPGCDGEITASQFKNAISELQSTQSYMGCFSIEPMLSIFRTLAEPLKRNRTPNIIVDANEGLLDVGADVNSLVVPRGIWPEIPKKWFSVAVVVNLQTMNVQPTAGGEA